jgi:predicted nucleic acid-binding protein
LADTSVVIDLETIPIERLPSGLAISALTLAELADGPPSASNAVIRRRRLRHKRVVESTFKALPFDSICAEAYGRVCAEVAAVGRRPGWGRSVDLMIAATALAYQLPLYTLNACDLRGLERLIEIVDLG